MMPSRLLDSRGSPVTPGKELGRGGEGAVFDVAGQPDVVAKVYLKPQNAQHAAKLSAMAGMATSSLLRVAAWPTGTLHDPSGAVVGFTMPKVGGHEPVFKLYGPKVRLQEFPKADWRFLIHAAANAARSFSTVHAAGLVIGDVNHGNLVVGQDTTVRMIDCDSFQVSQGGKIWFCEVGVGTHQPPEMQARTSYAGILRTPNQDNFGLAVIIFQLLCIARHPFAGRFKGAGEPPSIEDAIAASRYAYSRDRFRTAMEPPPASLPIDALTPTIQDLFEKAFAPGATRGGRPGAERWVDALSELSSDLKSCKANSTHFFRRTLSACPWCIIENASGIRLFPVVFKPGATPGATGMAALWQEVSKVPDPPPLGPCPLPPSAASIPSPEAQAIAGVENNKRAIAWVAVAASLLAALTIAPSGIGILMVIAVGVIAFLIQRNARTRQTHPFQQKLNDVKRDWNMLQRTWEAPPPTPSVMDIRASLSRIKTQHDALPNERASRLQRLNEQRRERQLEEHLDRAGLANAKIPGIGPTRVATLASYGIDTAGDIVSHRVTAVPGFGPATVTKLLAWRKSHEITFRFDPSRAVPPSDIAVIERDIASKRTKLEQEVAAGLPRLRAALVNQIARQQALEGRAAELHPQYAQALADIAVVPEDVVTPNRFFALSGTTVVLTLAMGMAETLPSPEGQPTAEVAQQATALPSANPVAQAGDPSRSEQSATDSIRMKAPPTALSSQKLSNPASIQDDIERVFLKQAANVRAGADGSSAVVRVAPNGARLRVFARSRGWIQIGEEEPWGWVYSGLVSKPR